MLTAWLTCSYLIPLTVGLVGLMYYKILRLPDKLVLASICVSFIFDANMLAGNYIELFYNPNKVAHFFPLCFTLVWSLAFLSVFESKSNERKVVFTLSLIALSSIAWFMLSGDLDDNTTKSSLRTINYLFIIGLALVYFIHAIINNDQRDFLKSSFFWYSSQNLIHYSVTIVIFTFFDFIKENENLLYFSIYLKWFFLLLSNLVFAYVFYSLKENNWSSGTYVDS